MAATATASCFSFSLLNHNQRYKDEIFIRNFRFLNKPNSKVTPLSPSSLGFRSAIGAYASRIEAIDSPITDYNAQICRFCELGNLRNAMELLSMSNKTLIGQKPYCSVLQLCADLKSLKDGKKVHSIIISNGVEIDKVLGSKLVFMYVKCGDLREGRTIFDKIENEKVFLWNLMMSEYAKIGDFREGIYLFKEMVERGIEANSYSFSSLLKCFAAIGSLNCGECVHGYLLKMGLGSDCGAVNSLISFYFRFNRVESARQVFDELTMRDVVSWNSMISGYVTNYLAEKGLDVFREMLCMGFEVDLATMVSVLSGCVNCGSLGMGRAVHALGVKTCFDRNVIFNNALLDVYSKCGDLDGAVRVFENMGERNIVSWTSMLAGYAREAQFSEAIRLFHEMERTDVKPDIIAVTSILHAFACSGSLEDGKELHNYIKAKKMELNLFVSNALMDMYAKCGSMEDANDVFCRMLVKDIVSWNTMIGGYSKNSLPNEALKLFSTMLHELKPDAVTMSCILPACASIAALERGREIHGYILRNGYSSDLHVANALVAMYVRCGALALARLVFDMIPSKDLVSWTSMIAGYGMHGFGNEAITTFNKMRETGIKADEVSFTSILYACSHSGLDKEGWSFFDKMRKDYHIKPKLEQYGCMVDVLARTGDLWKAYNFANSMPIVADAAIWESLLCGCRIHHDVVLAEKVAERLFELEPEKTEYYELLATIYAEAEKWEEVKKLREKMRINPRGAKRNPGYSWIEIRGKVKLFVAGDTSSHLESKKIESLLQKFSKKMKEKGGVPKTKYGLANANEMEKEIALCGHSEKFAMAFGLLNAAPGKTVRVIKSLRVCSDCHEMGKFMSKETRREIVLRDSNRFHHFKDGRCSCRGLW